MTKFPIVVIAASTIGGGYFGTKAMTKYLESQYGPPPFTQDTAGLSLAFGLFGGAIVGFKISGQIMLKTGMI